MWLPFFYTGLRQLAAAKMALERPGHGKREWAYACAWLSREIDTNK